MGEHVSVGCERPIIFSAPMVRALLVGTKTQTRRVVKPQLNDHHWYKLPGYTHHVSVHPNADGCAVHSCHMWAQSGADGMQRIQSPYGGVGDRLWVRETWLELDRDHWADPSAPKQDILCHPWPRANACAYRSDTTSDGDDIRKAYGYRWRPSIHMPRWASRITLEITDVRAQRLQDISEEDARAEGVKPAPFCKAGRPNGLEHVESFEQLWDSINGAGAWDGNPWVWAITFKRAEVANG